jgi:hypothetical protein
VNTKYLSSQVRAIPFLHLLRSLLTRTALLIQLLGTLDGGSDSLLSVLCTSSSPHTPSSSTGKATAYAQVFLVDIRTALDIAAKVQRNDSCYDARHDVCTALCVCVSNCTASA